MVFYCYGCDAERDTCEPTFCRDCGEATEGYALPTSEYLTADDLTPAAKARVAEVERQTLERYVERIERAFNAPRRVDQIKARRLTAAAATAAAIALATPAAASEPLLPVATDDADSFHLPPEWPVAAPVPAEPSQPIVPTRPDMTGDRVAMCAAFAFDGATTIYAVERGAVESAPMTKLILGKRPGPAAVVGFMAAKCGAFLALGSLVENKDTRLARLFYRLNIGISAAAGANNIRVGLRIKL